MWSLPADLQLSHVLKSGQFLHTARCHLTADALIQDVVAAPAATVLAVTKYSLLGSQHHIVIDGHFSNKVIINHHVVLSGFVACGHCQHTGSWQVD
jgi:hypothetical protein